METTAFKLQATIHAEAQTERTRFSPAVTFLLEPQCATTTLLLIGRKPGRAFIFPLISTSIFFLHIRKHCCIVLSPIPLSQTPQLLTTNTTKSNFQVEVSRH